MGDRASLGAADWGARGFADGWSARLRDKVRWRLSFAAKFGLACLLLLTVGAGLAGWWIEHCLTAAVVKRNAQLTGEHVQLLMAPYLADLRQGKPLNEAALRELDRHFDSPNSAISSLRTLIWDAQGRMVYGAGLDPDDNLSMGNAAWRPVGDSGIGVRTAPLPADAFPAGSDGLLTQMRIPLTGPDGAGRHGTVELYSDLDPLVPHLRSAKLRVWLVIALGTGSVYLLLLGTARQASRTMTEQREALAGNVLKLQELLTQNRRMRARLRRAGGRTTTLNEQCLRRLSADLHDGPGQDLALALLRLDEIQEQCPSNCRVKSSGSLQADFLSIRSALDSALREVRTCCAELRLPGFERLTVEQVVARVVRDFQRKTGQTVAVSCAGDLGEAPLDIKIALYRVIQEALGNGFRHGGGAAQRVFVQGTPTELIVEVADRGPGMASVAIPEDGERLGLRGMRERVEVLEGCFEIRSTVGEGTTVHARLPRTIGESIA